MNTLLRLLPALAILSVPAWGQAAPAPVESQQRSNIKAALIIEEFTNTIVFEMDGTGTRDQHARVRILSGAALQKYSVLAFFYSQSNEDVQIIDVHVRKPDGTIVKTGQEDMQDLPSEVSRVAPLYSDFREKHVPVKGLGVGDELEFQTHAVIKTPVISGQFVFEYRTIQDEVVQNENLTMKVPLASAAIVKSP